MLTSWFKCWIAVTVMLPSVFFVRMPASSVVSGSTSVTTSPSPSTTAYRRRRRDRQRSQLQEQESITQELKARFGHAMTSPTLDSSGHDDASVTHESVLSPSSMRERSECIVTSPRRLRTTPPSSAQQSPYSLTRDVTSPRRSDFSPTNTNSNNISQQQQQHSSATSSVSNYVIASSVNGSMSVGGHPMTNGHSHASSEQISHDPQLGVISMFGNQTSYGGEEGGHPRYTTRRFYPASSRHQRSDTNLLARGAASSPLLDDNTSRGRSELATNFVEHNNTSARVAWPDDVTSLPPAQPPAAHAQSEVSVASSDSDAVVWYDAPSATSIDMNMTSQPVDATASEFVTTRTTSELVMPEPYQTTSEILPEVGVGDCFSDGETSYTRSVPYRNLYTRNLPNCRTMCTCTLSPSFALCY